MREVGVEVASSGKEQSLQRGVRLDRRLMLDWMDRWAQQEGTGARTDGGREIPKDYVVLVNRRPD